MLRALVLALGLFAACAQPAVTTPEPENVPPLVVMSFNVRYGTANDGLDAWPLRCEAVAQCIQETAPDILGVQEALEFQIAFLEQRLPGHVRVGQGREGGTKGEHASLFLSGARFELVEHGDFWLSETPQQVASVGWDAALTRMCTWARVRDRASGSELTVWNTHFDHRGELARERSAQLIAARVRERAGPHLVIGDLNAGEHSAPLAALREVGLVDTYRALHPHEHAAGTFHAFRGGLDGERIDYILCSPQFAPSRAEILSAPGATGRWPSDHHPVVAHLRAPSR